MSNFIIPFVTGIIGYAVVNAIAPAHSNPWVMLAGAITLVISLILSSLWDEFVK